MFTLWFRLEFINQLKIVLYDQNMPGRARGFGIAQSPDFMANRYKPGSLRLSNRAAIE